MDNVSSVRVKQLKYKTHVKICTEHPNINITFAGGTTAIFLKLYIVIAV